MHICRAEVHMLNLEAYLKKEEEQDNSSFGLTCWE
jgi:hypothetical protein